MASVKMPTPAELKQVGSELGMNLSDADVAFFQETMAGNVAAYALLESLPDNLPVVTYPRTPGYRPEGEENKYNPWYVKSEVEGRARGQAQGQERGAEGQRLPGRRADDERRLHPRRLHARRRRHGRHARARCRRHDRRQGALRVFLLLRRQPHQRRRPGPQPAQVAATRPAARLRAARRIIVTGEADMAIGGDQGGSIRMPAAYCGIVGMKPTWGLVPYTGIMPIELTLDHTGPMTATVADNALMLEVIAGPDGLDPRQMGCTVDAYTKALGGSVAGLRDRRGQGRLRPSAVGEGGRRAGAKGAASFKELGATVEEVSIPAPDRHGGVVGDRRRRRDLADDAGQRLRLQLEGPLRHQPGRCALGVARARRRIVRHAEEHHPVRQVRAQQVSRPLLRQGAEPRRASSPPPTIRRWPSTTCS